MRLSNLIESRSGGMQDARGFVLLSVLLVIAVLCTLLTAMTMSARAVRLNAVIERRLVQASLLADAGLTRVIAALETMDDPLLSSLFSSTRWRIAGHEVSVSLIPEAGKVDLNSGESDLIVNVFRAVVQDDAQANRLIRRLGAMRSAGQYVETVRGILDPYERVGPLAHDLEAVFTVWTSLRGVDPKAAPAIVLRNLPGLQQGEADLLLQARERGIYSELSPFVARFESLLGATRPIYRARAEATFEGVTARREVLLTHNTMTRVVWVVFWRDMME